MVKIVKLTSEFNGNLEEKFYIEQNGKFIPIYFNRDESIEVKYKSKKVVGEITLDDRKLSLAW